MIHFLPFATMLLWMLGGQINKGLRRFGVPAISLIGIYIRIISKWSKIGSKNWWRGWLILLYIPILSTGYGVDSCLMKIFKKDWLVRIMYGLFLALPQVLYCLIVGKYVLLLIPLIGLPVICSIRGGSLGKVGKYDLLIEDVLRGFFFGQTILWVLK